MRHGGNEGTSTQTGVDGSPHFTSVHLREPKPSTPGREMMETSQQKEEIKKSVRTAWRQREDKTFPNYTV